MLRFSAFVVLSAVLIFSSSTQAGSLGPLDGRSPDSSQMSTMSIEVGYVSEGELSSFSGRFNYQFSPLLTVYGDVGLVDVDNGDGGAFGIGVRYYLSNQRIVPQLDLAVRASYHTSTVEFDMTSGSERDLSELSFAVHFGGKEAFYSHGLKWYGVVSFNQLSAASSGSVVASDTDNTELGFGGGVYMPLGPGEAYFGMENIDEMFVGIGYRHFLGSVRY